MSTVYGSDPFAYDLKTALAGAESSPSIAARSYDVFTGEGERGGSLPTIVGLWDGNYCRRCNCVFPLSGKQARLEHREWHEWKDQNQAISTPELDEQASYASLRPLAGYKPDEGAKVVSLQSVNRKTLVTHRTKFEPRGQSFSKARKLHRESCDEVAKAFGLTADSLGGMVIELRREGLDVAGIAERTGASAKQVRALLAS